MEILHVLPTFCKGGGEKLVHDLANHQVDNGNDVQILCVYKNLEQGAFLEKTLSSEININYISKLVQNKSIGNNLFNILKKLKYYVLIILWFFKNKKFLYSFDIINVHLTYGAFLGTLLYLFRPLKAKTKIVETNHTDSSSIRGLLKLFFNMNRRFRDAIIFELKENDYNAFKKELPSIKSIFIPIGSSAPNILDESNINKEILKGKVRIGQIGRIHFNDRRTDQYVYLVNELKKTIGDTFIFYIYGDGPDRLEFENIINDLNLNESIKLMGYTDDIGAAFKNLDIYITINVGENCGVAGLQAIWSGLPTFAIQVDKTYKETALEDIIPNSLNLKILSNYMKNLMGQDQGLKQLSERQYAHVLSNNSIDSYCYKTQEFYKALF